MRNVRIVALTLVFVIAVLSLAGSLLPRFDYSRQDREHFSTSPTSEHWLGSDAVGRDRLARLVHGTRVSLSLAPAAAGLSMVLAFVLGAAPAFAGGEAERAAKAAIDLMLSVPWLFLLLLIRALLPLNTSPGTSAVITFTMLGLLGWGMPGRILMARARALRESEFVLAARAAGIPSRRLLWVSIAPNLWPVLLAQFWIALPLFILAEANLSLLGLGVGEPMPSLGSLLRDLESVMSLRSDLASFAGLAVLLLIVGSLQVVAHEREVN